MAKIFKLISVLSVILTGSPGAAADTTSGTTILPFAEYDPVKYLFMDASFKFHSENAKKTIARNLPAEVDLIITVKPGDDANEVLSEFSGLRPAGAVKIVQWRDDPGFWVRDSLPFAVVKQTPENKFTELVDHRFFGSEPDQAVASLLNRPITTHHELFEGGNIIANAIGDCLVIQNQYATLSAESLKRYYGCRRVLKFPHIDGIGHADERLKFLNESTVLTDTPEYVDALFAANFVVVMAPRPVNGSGSYLNSLFINGTAFVPNFDAPTDKIANKVYETFGFRVVPILARKLAESGSGLIHCMTMAYPDF